MKKFKILYIAAVALLLAACANEEDGIDNSGPVAATVQADISKTEHVQPLAIHGQRMMP